MPRPPRFPGKGNLPNVPLRWTPKDAAREFNRDEIALIKKLIAMGTEPGSDGCFNSAQIAEALFGGVSVERRRLIAEQADGYALDNARKRGELLDRNLVVSGLESVFLAIKQYVLASELSREAKDDILSNIAGLEVIITNVTEAQGSNVYLNNGETEETPEAEDLGDEAEAATTQA
jgi:hypothetical protein